MVIAATDPGSQRKGRIIAGTGDCDGLHAAFHLIMRLFDLRHASQCGVIDLVRQQRDRFRISGPNRNYPEGIRVV